MQTCEMQNAAQRQNLINKHTNCQWKTSFNCMSLLMQTCFCSLTGNTALKTMVWIKTDVFMKVTWDQIHFKLIFIVILENHIWKERQNLMLLIPSYWIM